MVHIFASPHFDDAILSCGGTIHQLITAGETVRAVTMMGGLFKGTLPDTPILQDLHQRWQAGENPLLTRQNEDIRALETLDASFMHIPLPDCVYRLVNGIALYPSEESLFDEVHPEDPAPTFLSEIGIPFQQMVDVLYIPLGVGHHVDHQIVRDWGLAWLKRKPEKLEIKFYAEYPYLNTSEAIEQALGYFSISLRPNNVILSKEDIQAKIKAIACYETQLSTFWKGLDAMEADVKRASTHPQTGDYVERYWEIINT